MVLSLQEKTKCGMSVPLFVCNVPDGIFIFNLDILIFLMYIIFFNIHFFRQDQRHIEHSSKINGRTPGHCYKSNTLLQMSQTFTTNSERYKFDGCTYIWCRKITYLF